MRQRPPSARGLTRYPCSLMTGAMRHQRSLAKRQAVAGVMPLGEQILCQSILPSSLRMVHCSEEMLRIGDVSHVSHLLHGERRPQRASVAQRIARHRAVAGRSVCSGLYMHVPNNETLTGETFF